jgi:hypothetical protein
MIPVITFYVSFIILPLIEQLSSNNTTADKNKETAEPFL